jgi:hypothetical protein
MIKKYKIKFITRNEQSVVYSFTKKEQTALNNSLSNINKISEIFLSSIKILYNNKDRNYSRDKVDITYYYYVIDNIDNDKCINANHINNIGTLLRKISNIPIKLNFHELKYPYLDRDILRKYIGLQTEHIKFEQIKENLFNAIPLIDKNIIKSNDNNISNITGVSIEVSGRLTTERVRPRQTKSIGKIGSFIQRNRLTILNKGSHTIKNKNGALTIKTRINQQLTPLFSLTFEN